MHYLADVPIDKVRIMGVINVSPESFYKGSVKISPREITRAASGIEDNGADFIDIGAMSTAPYLKTMISEREEIERIKAAVRAARDGSSLPISVDTPRAATAEAALTEGATIVNDVTGLKYDREMARVIHQNDASTILCAYEKLPVRGDIVKVTVSALRKSLRMAKQAGVKENKITVDPAIGFFREKGNHPFFTKMKSGNWLQRDLSLINQLKKFNILRKPVCVSVSRKSFIGKILNLEKPEDRLYGSITAEAVCVLNGAKIIRTHNVKESMHAVKVAGALMKYSR